MQNYLPILIGLALAVLAAKSDAQTRTAYEVAFEPNVEMKTRDGVSLRADIYRPKAGGKFPVLINRTPYDKRHPLYIPDGIASAQRGYVFITQDA